MVYLSELKASLQIFESFLDRSYPNTCKLAFIRREREFENHVTLVRG